MSRLRTWSLKKFLLLGLPLALLVFMMAASYWLLYTTTGAAWMWNKLEDIAAGALHGSHVEGDLASGFVIQGIEYRSDTVELLVNRVEIQAGPGWWPMSIQVQALTLDDVAIVTRTPGDGVQPGNRETDIHAVLETLKFPVPLQLHDGALTHISLQQGDGPAQTLIESLRIRATLDERLIVDQLDLIAPGLQAGLHGFVQLKPPYELAATAEGRYELSGQGGVTELILPFKLVSSGKLDEIQFSLASQDEGLQLGGEVLGLVVSGSASDGNIQISNAALTAPGVNLEVSGKLDWSFKPEAGLRAVVHQLDLSAWLQNWPAGEFMTGDFELTWMADRLRIPTGSLTVAGTDMLINIGADIDVNANHVNAQLDWSGLKWPLVGETPGFSSPSGSLGISGSIDRWTSTGQLVLQLGDYPRGKLEIQGGGDRTSARLSILEGEVLGGSISGEAGANWAGDLIWDAAILSRDIDPEPLLPGWPGRLDAEIEIAAQSQPEQVQINVVSLQGLMRGVPLSASGGIRIETNNVTFSHLEVRSDEAQLLLDGRVADPEGVTVTFDGYLPSKLLSGVSGKLDLQGRYSSNASQPLFDVQIEALDLAWNGFDLKGLSASLTLVPDNTEDVFASPWRGVLEGFEVLISQSYHLDLLEPAPIAWSSGTVSVGPVCLHEDKGAGLCLEGQYQTIGDWSMDADIKAVPFDYLRDILELNVHFEQLLEGHMQWHQLHGQVPTGGADFRITAGRILDQDDDDLLVETRQGRFAFALQNGNLESGVLDIEFPGIGFIDVDFEVRDIIEGGVPTLQGRAIARLDDIRLPAQLVLPGVDDVGGFFESNITLGGSLADPAFSGGFRFSNGFVQYAPIGLVLEDIEFEGRVEQSDRGTLKGRFKAGQGIGSIEGRFLFDDIENPQIDISFSGDELLLIDTDDLKILTETDLKVGLSPQRLEINGFIRVPSARLTPANLQLGGINDSEDLVIESRGEGSEPGPDEASPENRVYGQLEVAFGDDVLIQVPGIETGLSGSVMFTWNGDPVPLAQGRYELQGKVDVYGPTLQINNGHISFPEVPANNPLLNIRAEREIFGNTQIRSAGVQVIGTLKRPVLEAYTVPVTNEDRAWTLLVTGTDFDQGQGVGGFDVGTYIAPRLYVSYGVSLFEDENVISARYDLKKGFGVKVTSGQRESGLDISYTIDR